MIRKILSEHIDNLEDLESFGMVCNSWRSEKKDVNYMNLKNTQFPWLMLADSPTNSYRRFYSMRKDMVRKINLPRFDDDDHRRYFSSKGWLIGVSRKQALICFFDPFTGSVIKPPSHPLVEFLDGDTWDDEDFIIQFSKFVFSTRPKTGDDFEVAMVFHSAKHIVFWRPVQQGWIESNVRLFQIDDVCFFRGEFYSIDHYSQVIAYGSEIPKKPRIVTNLKSQGLIPYLPYKFYIVVLETTQTLLVIHRLVHLKRRKDINKYWNTLSFQLFELDVDTGKARQVKNIGNRALFVGYNSTFFVEASSASDKRGCRPNCIYFTDDNMEYWLSSFEGGGMDMGIFSLDQRKVVAPDYQGPPQFSQETPPIWLELPQS
ncbi:hypothetical protein BVRB_3g051830 [Beta vulgaris subsp. vulgaris]|nr:hypothetical protein BVRB_3g051830 [Beta vulgaris subsp. vulgaris]